MARIRSIKPTFWTDEKVVETTPWARLLFVGTWNFCDDAGRMEYSPKRLKMQIFPGDSVEVGELVRELEDKKQIVIYEVDGKQYLQVVNFQKHQHIDKRTPSKYPAPRDFPPDSPESPPNLPDSSGEIPRKGREGNGMEGNGSTPPATAGGESKSPSTPDCPHEKIIELYHQALPELPEVASWTPTRKGYLQARWREDKRHQTLEWWERFFRFVHESDFLCGRAKPQPGKKPFRADLEWLITQGNFVKILEKKYHE